MNKILRALLAVVFALACIDGHAKATRHCIVALEAHAAPTAEIPATRPKPACPVALARDDARDDARDATTRSMPAPGTLDPRDNAATPRA